MIEQLPKNFDPLGPEYTYQPKVHWRTLQGIRCGAVGLIEALKRTGRPYRELTSTEEFTEVTCRACINKFFTPALFKAWAEKRKTVL